VGEGEGEPKQVWFAVFSITTSTALSDFYETQCFCFSNRWCDRAVMDSILAKVLVGDRQFSVLLASMITKLKLDPGDQAMRRLRKHSVRWGLQHRTGSR
jgi:hypothetical protein